MLPESVCRTIPSEYLLGCIIIDFYFSFKRFGDARPIAVLFGGFVTEKRDYPNFIGEATAKGDDLTSGLLLRMFY